MHAHDGRVYHPPGQRLSMSWACGPCTCPKTREVPSSARDVIRPGLELYGFCDYFDPPPHYRAGPFGNGHAAKLGGRRRRPRRLSISSALRPATVIVARDITPARGCWPRRKSMTFLLSSKDSTSNVVADLVSLLNVELAPASPATAC